MPQQQSNGFQTRDFINNPHPQQLPTQQGSLITC
jgi:hypothetical protein